MTLMYIIIYAIYNMELHLKKNRFKFDLPRFEFVCKKKVFVAHNVIYYLTYNIV